MIVTCREMQAAEAALFATGVPAEPLMDKAGARCAETIKHMVGAPGRATLYCGRGNNGGDALVVGAWLRKWGWQVDTRFSHSKEERSELSQKKLAELHGIPDGPGGDRRILIDGLLGIGAVGALRGRIGTLADEMNRFRNEDSALTFAIDIPSGVDGDTGECYDGAVIADHTLTICRPKSGLVSEQAINHVGRLHLIPLPEIPVTNGDDTISLLVSESMELRLTRRAFDTHKGKAGRVSIVAGSRGLTGAAVLSALGALNTGAGLVTVFVPGEIYPIVASRAPVEVMVRPYERSIEEIIDHPADVFAIGPGLGSEVNRKILEFAVSDDRPMVLDADLLNWISENPELLDRLPEGKRVLTPHPGELARLTKSRGDRIELTRQLADQWGVTLLHKGARTVIATPGETIGINSTGTPEMASGGMGDVLSGMAASLIGQGHSLHDAACLGSWTLGRAAEITSHPVTASRVAKSLGSALAELKEKTL